MTPDAEYPTPSFAVPPQMKRADRLAAPPRHGRFRHGLADATRHLGPPFVLGVIAVTIVASSVGLLLTHVLDNSFIVHFDVRLAETLADHRTTQLTKLTGIGTFFADPIPVAGFWLLAVVISAIALRHWRPPMLFMIAIGGEKLSYFLSTLIVDRPRPQVETVGKVHVTSSYPSGHVGSAISLWATLALLIVTLIAGRLTKRGVIVPIIVGAFFAAEVGYSRLYRGHHFFTDVVMGTVIGATWVIIGYKFVLAPYLTEQRELRRGPASTSTSTYERAAS
ncbi:MAG: phosphatase PAP2 family protein [Acidimicrobiales bacterium]